MVRTPSFDKNGRKKGAWSPEEDNKLRAYVQRYGHWNWRELPRFAGLSRCGKSCRLRWINYLRPHVKLGNYTKEEEDLILKLHEQLGNKWSTIAAKLPGRTDNEIKNHWHTHLKKRSNKNQTTFEPTKHNIELNQFEANQITVSVPEIWSILESTPPSPELSSCEFSSSSTCDFAISSDEKWVTEEGTTLSESFDKAIGNFWTEPFLADSSYNRNAYSSNLVEGGLFSPESLYFDDGMDLFYQVLQDFSRN